MSFIIHRLNVALKRCEDLIIHYITNGFPPGALCAVDASQFDSKSIHANQPKLFDLEKLKESFLYAVPVHRRSVEVRRMRKFGVPKYVWKPHVPRTDILTCLKCGHHHIAYTLCPNCYSIIKQETEKLQEEIQKELGLEPVEKEVIVLYEGEKNDDFWKKQRIVEVPRKRPNWFVSNLLQSSNNKEENTTNDIPTIEAKVSNV